MREYNALKCECYRLGLISVLPSFLLQKCGESSNVTFGPHLGRANRWRENWSTFGPRDYAKTTDPLFVSFPPHLPSREQLVMTIRVADFLREVAETRHTHIDRMSETAKQQEGCGRPSAHPLAPCQLELYVVLADTTRKVWAGAGGVAAAAPHHRRLLSPSQGDVSGHSRAMSAVKGEKNN